MTTTQTARRGHITTFTGKHFYPWSSGPEDVCIEDIARHLSMICRFNGALRTFYSVAEHSVLVASYLPESLKLYGLLHDASEAYGISDLPSPFKRTLTEYKAAEDRIFKEAIAPAFGLDYPMPHLIKIADKDALYYEEDTYRPWSISTRPALTPEQAEREFLAHFRALWV